MTVSGKAIHILGGGGHAKVAVATAEAAGIAVAAVYDDDVAKIGSHLIGHKIVGAVSSTTWWLEADAVGLIAIGSNHVRQQMAAEYPARWQSLVHPTAWIHPSVKIGAGTLVCAGAIIQPDAIIGAHCIVNTGAVIEHDCQIGDFAHLGPTSCLAGAVSVGEGVLLGAGAVVMPAIQIGAWSVVGAGAAVAADVADRVTVAGVPARPIV